MSKTLETPQISRIEVLASGLDGRRKLNFAPDGALYVAKAGRVRTGASIPSPSLPGASLFYGATGAITRIQNSVPERVVTVIDNQNIPVSLIAGTLDSIANFGEVASTYVKVQDTPKALIAIEGANHYGITNTDNLTREPNRPTLEQETATGAIGRWSGLFLRANLLNAIDAFNFVYNIGGDLNSNVSVISQVARK